jgi:hypothetical protein
MKPSVGEQPLFLKQARMEISFPNLPIAVFPRVFPGLLRLSHAQVAFGKSLLMVRVASCFPQALPAPQMSGPH